MTKPNPGRVAQLLAAAFLAGLLVAVPLLTTPAQSNPFAKSAFPWNINEIEKTNKAPEKDKASLPPIPGMENTKRYLVLKVRFKQVPEEKELNGFRLENEKKKAIGNFLSHNGKDKKGKEGIVDLVFEGAWDDLAGLTLTGGGHKELLVAPKESDTKDKEKKTDPPKTGTDDEAQAASALRLAKYYIENKKPDKAKEKLEMILKNYPKTEAAKEAAKLLKDLK